MRTDASAKTFKTRRLALVEGFNLLKKEGYSLEEMEIRIAASSMTLPSGDTVSFVGLVSNHPDRPSVAFPACSGIRATNSSGITGEFEADAFGDATVDKRGNVQLADGTFLHNCRIVRKQLPSEWDNSRHWVINLAIAFKKKEEACYQEIGYAASGETGVVEAFYTPAQAGSLNAFINYTAVRNLDFTGEKLDAFIAYYEQHTPTKRRLSRQTIANILRDAGVRMPLKRRPQ